MRIVIFAATLLGLAHGAIAAEARPEPAASPSPNRYSLQRSVVEPAPPGSGRYSVRGRVAPLESAGELREGGNFALIGRISPKAATSCSATTLFRNGFE